MKELDINTYPLNKAFESLSHLITESESFNDITLKAILISMVQIQQIQINLIKSIADHVRLHDKGFNDIMENLKTYNELTKINSESIRMLVDRA